MTSKLGQLDVPAGKRRTDPGAEQGQGTKLWAGSKKRGHFPCEVWVKLSNVCPLCQEGRTERGGTKPAEAKRKSPFLCCGNGNAMLLLLNFSCQHRARLVDSGWDTQSQGNWIAC